ncbi:MAG TPA: glycosyltransferase family 39 protein, partial [Tepidisphaeraceae bacterium]|nr:glycosyltransferase family 39 protein [Tepidisphaeraceae bacterium]
MLLRRKPPAEPIALVAVMIVSLALKLRHLGHRRLTHWDESFHAIVARNLLRHPLIPTLTDKIYFPDLYKNWTLGHIWLHKPILPLWQIAASFAILGDSALALRLPSAILSVATVALTYLIGARLLDRRSALLGATLQAFSPVIFGQVQGYMLADHIDTALLFWVELGIYFLARAIDRPNRRDLIFAGVATGLAYLCKDFLAAIVPALAIVAFFLARIRRMKMSADFAPRLRVSHVAILVGIAILTALPWTLWSYLEFPRQFLWEHLQMLRHVSNPIAGWGAPWYRAAFSYLMFLFGQAYLPVMLTLIIASVAAVRRGDGRLLFLVAWAAGVILATLLAATKTPLAAIVSLPPAMLLLGWLVSSAFRRQPRLLSLAAAVMACCILWPPHRSTWQEILPTPAEFPTHPLSAAWWLVWRCGVTLLVAIVFFTLCRFLPRFSRLFFATVALVGFVIVLGDFERQSFAITSIDLDSPNMIQVGAIADARLPSNGVLLMDDDGDGGAENLAFRSRHTVYSLPALERQSGGNAVTVCGIIRGNGGTPFIVSAKTLLYPVIAQCPKDGFTIFA